MIKKITTVVLPVVALALAGGVHLAAAQGRAALVQAEPVVFTEITETVPVQANVVAGTESTVAVRVAGFVRSTPVAVGDVVAAGQVLVELDERPLRLAYSVAVATAAAANSSRAAAEARVALASQVVDRLRGLGSSAALSQGALDDAEQELRLAHAGLQEAADRVAAADARLDSAQFDLDSRRVVAPFAGVVLSRSAQLGAYLKAGDPVARLLDTGSLELEAEVPGQVLSGLTVGGQVNGQFESGEPLTAVVRAVVPVENARTRTRPVRLTLSRPPESISLAVGQTVVISVPRQAPREVLTVAKDALIREAGGWVVLVVVDGAAAQRLVELGAFAGDRVEVLSGLAAGDVAIVRGNERLRPGQPVTVQGTDGASGQSQ